MEQMTFLPKINRKATQKKVEKALETTLMYRKFGFVRREMSITPSYSHRYHGPTNATSNPAESCAIKNVDGEEYMRIISERVEKALERMDPEERAIIEKRYLDHSKNFDYEVYNEIGMAKRTYDRVKARAVYNLAFALRLEVYYAS